MEEKELSLLSDQELLEKKRIAKSSELTNAVILGALIGIAIYSTINSGLGFFTFLPIFFALFATTKWRKSNKALEEELKSRNLK